MVDDLQSGHVNCNDEFIPVTQTERAVERILCASSKLSKHGRLEVVFGLYDLGVLEECEAIAFVQGILSA